ncbi:hypothetical protein L210DRAFT_3646144 [Boletus edulis BED1]|uniref:Uncharacterized protein n=1 Tax=Boletus edulis BED1 TaxID=1328754 RepID=A0AAD4GF73_BOLED|nr:hypothetical protein L210DRAFT_3646144 [Boletus edulis BED1]
MENAHKLCTPEPSMIVIETAKQTSEFHIVCLSLKVHLPRLAYFSIVAPFSRLAWFLSCIDIPAMTQVRLSRVSGRNPLECEQSRAIQRIPLGDSVIPRTRKLSVMQSRTGWRMSIAFSASEHDCSHPMDELGCYEDCDCDIPLKAHVVQEFGTESWYDVVVGICRNVALAHLDNIILGGYHGRFDDIFGYLGQLQDSELHHDAFLPLLENAYGTEDQYTRYRRLGGAKQKLLS